MNIKSFEVWNFKSMEYSGEIRFPKITILIGANSSGKSSIGQSLLLMKQTLEADEPSIPLVLNGSHLQLGEYGDFIHDKNINNSFKIKFNFENYKQLSPYRCKVCQKDFKFKGWFLKHVAKEHAKYWKKKEVDVATDQYYSPKRPSLRFQYNFDSETKTILPQEIEIENPISSRGLNLRSLKIEQLKERKIKFEAVSYYGQIIFSKMLTIPKNIESIDHNLMVQLFQYFTRRVPHYSYLFHPKSYEQVALVENDLGKILNFEFPEKLELGKSYIYWNEPSQLPRDLNEEQKLALGIQIGLSDVANFMAARLQDIKTFLHDIHHVGPLRNWPERIYFGTSGKPASVGGRGQFTQEIIWIDKRAGHERLIHDINNWLEKLKLDIKLEVVPLGLGEIYQLRVKEKKLSINIADVGFGISQILPIITECINYSYQNPETKIDDNFFLYGIEKDTNTNKLLIIEQPEIHLNPRIQAELGDFFIDIGKSDRALFIETHSEHIISRIQRRVADETLNPEDIVIYFVSKKGNKSETKEISISRTGQFSYWPEGFFQDDFEDAIEILKKSLRQQEEK